jgi:hypothetical protein
MAATVNDPAYRADAEREQLDVDPVAGAEVEGIIRRAYGAPAEIIARLAESMRPPR